MPAFEGPQEFLESLRWGACVGRPSTPLIHLISRYAVLRRKLGWRPVMTPAPLGWFSTGRGPALRATSSPPPTTRSPPAAWTRAIAVVFCNREPGEDPKTDLFLEQVRGYGLPLVTLSSLRFRRRAWRKPRKAGRAAAGVAPRLRPRGDAPAGAVPVRPRRAGRLHAHREEALCERYDLLNLHPAAPGGPAGIWQDVIWQLIEAAGRPLPA